MEKFQKTFEKWAELNRQLYTDCKEYLIKTLEKLPDNEVCLDMNNQPCVTYDGGNHPEYAATPFSVVNKVYLRNGNVYLNTEDCSGYNIENINAEELLNVADAVATYIETDYDLEDD